MIAGDGVPPVAPDSDSDLVRRTREGDAGAYGILYERHYPALQHIARHYSGGDPAVTEDLVHDAFTRFLLRVRRGGYREEGKLVSYLSRLTSRLGIDYVRRHHHHREYHAGLGQPDDTLYAIGERQGIDHQDEALDLVLLKERQEATRRLIEALPDKEAAAMVLSSSGITMDRASTYLGTSVGGVKARLWRARAIAEVLIRTDPRFDAIRPVDHGGERKRSTAFLPMAYRPSVEGTASCPTAAPEPRTPPSAPTTSSERSPVTPRGASASRASSGARG